MVCAIPQSGETAAFLSRFALSPLSHVEEKACFPCVQNFRALNTSRSSPLNCENALSMVIIWNPKRMEKAAK